MLRHEQNGENGTRPNLIVESLKIDEHDIL